MGSEWQNIVSQIDEMQKLLEQVSCIVLRCPWSCLWVWWPAWPALTSCCFKESPQAVTVEVNDQLRITVAYAPITQW